MGYMAVFAQELAESMGFDDIHPIVLEICQRILDVKNFPLADKIREQIKIARIIRQERKIAICCFCKKFRSHDQWFRGDIPPGVQSHGMCEPCYDNFIKEQDDKQRSKRIA